MELIFDYLDKPFTSFKEAKVYYKYFVVRKVKISAKCSKYDMAKILKNMPAKVKSLDVSEQYIIDSDLSHIRKHIKKLNLQGCRYITPNGLAQMKCRNLMELNLSKTNIKDEAIPKLTYFKKLHTLNISDTKITVIGMYNIRYLTQLRTLKLGGRQVSNTLLTILSLANMPHLVNLDLSNCTNLSGDILKCLKSMNLRTLNLTNTKIKNGDLKYLKDLKLNSITVMCANIYYIFTIFGISDDRDFIDYIKHIPNRTVICITNNGHRHIFPRFGDAWDNSKVICI